jgi:predicted transcriptional regulator
MPAFKKAKYTVEQSQEIMMRAFGALCDSSVPMTIDEIQQADLFLVSTTAQKMSRVLNELVEKGVVAKTKSKAKGGRMVYMSIEVLEKQGFEKERLVC